MRIETGQHMQLGQQMKLAPRMIQSMEILQMPLLALQERIEQELESNIALEVVEPGRELDEVRAEQAEERREEAIDQQELVIGETGDRQTDDWERLSVMESSYGAAFDNEYSSERFSPARAAQASDRKMEAMANTAARPEGLIEQLAHQWTFAEVPPDVAAMGALIIQYIDDDGMLSADLETIREQNRGIPGVEITEELYEQSLREVQRWLDPPGIAARNPRESLLLQIDRLEQDAEDEHDWQDVRCLIENHFDDLLQNRLPKISQEAQIPIARIQAAIELMRRLSLSPGRDLVDEGVPPIIPDVIVEFDEAEDAYVASLSNGFLPSLRVSRRYAQMAKDKSVDKQTREFVGRNVSNANWLIDSINQRKGTLLRVVNVVLARQRDYFDHGTQYLRPLPMIEVADQLGIHVGTVSRAVSDKWLQTPRGLVALRKFFSGGRETDSGRDMSWEAVKATLKEVIDAEDKTRPLSDEALAAELRKRGIEIARRTVVKYRQQMDIPPARRRRIFTSKKD